MKYRYSKTAPGFTIVEVLIVLSIASLILLVVFLAVPQLQRSARNNQRGADANKILTAVNECIVNNNGIMSACLSSSTATATAPNQSSTQPGTTNPVIGSAGTLDMSKIQSGSSVTIYTPCGNAAGSAAAFPSGTSIYSVYCGYTCQGVNLSTTTSNNPFVVLYNRESGNVNSPLNTCLASQ